MPDSEGFAGSFAGVHNGALMVAGGANFPEKRPWEGGTKVWHDAVFVLKKPNSEWKTGFKLARPLGYGVSLTHKSGVICMGGSDSKRHYADVFVMTWSRGAIHVKSLPSLPSPCANMCGALLGNNIYLAGGLAAPDATNALKTFWTFDLQKPEAGWRELEPWPGPERMLAVASAQNDSFYIFGGANLKKGTEGKLVREWLRDAYCFTAGIGWKRISDLPRAAVAAPSPAPLLDNYFLILGGDDGSQVDTLPTEHRGFSRDILAYGIRTDSWKTCGEIPVALVTTPSATWNRKIIIPGGEARPGIRSTNVWAGSPIRPR